MELDPNDSSQTRSLLTHRASYASRIGRFRRGNFPFYSAFFEVASARLSQFDTPVWVDFPPWGSRAALRFAVNRISRSGRFARFRSSDGLRRRGWQRSSEIGEACFLREVLNRITK